MNTKRTSKINQLISQWKRGVVYTQSYLSRLGYYHDLIKIYKRNGWLDSIGTGAYKLSNDQVDVFGGIYALQQQLHLPVHVGGRSALVIKGYGHYSRVEGETFYLFAPSGTRLPKWFTKYDCGVDVLFKATNLFSHSVQGSFSQYKHKDFSIKISAPERAAIEMLYYVPSHQGFNEAMRIMEGLMTLRPIQVQQLLENCQSVKVKRLFLFMSEKFELPWVEKLKLDKIDTGSGKRVIVNNGVLDKKYLITVPKESSY